VIELMMRTADCFSGSTSIIRNRLNQCSAFNVTQLTTRRVGLCLLVSVPFFGLELSLVTHSSLLTALKASHFYIKSIAALFEFGFERTVVNAGALLSFPLASKLMMITCLFAGLGGARSVWQDPLHGLQRVQAQV
jgi:hypothetical protein